MGVVFGYWGGVGILQANSHTGVQTQRARLRKFMQKWLSNVVFLAVVVVGVLLSSGPIYKEISMWSNRYMSNLNPKLYTLNP